MRIEELMTRSPKSCCPSDTLGEAAQMLWDGDCGCLPVIAGDHIHTAIIAAYGADRAAMLIDDDFGKSPWLSRADLERGWVRICVDSNACAGPEGEAPDASERLTIDDRSFQIALFAPR